MKVILKGVFLGTDDYFKKDKDGNQTNEKVHVISIFDGKDAIQINGVDGSALKFGDEVSLNCEIFGYKDKPGFWLRASS